MTAAPTLVLAEVAKRFGDRPVVQGVSFAVGPGEFVALLGPSGAGKTTLIRAAAGLLSPDAGRIELDGRDVASLARRQRRRIAVVFQQFNLVGRLSALDNVLAGRLGHVPTWRGVLRRFERKDRLLALECLDRVGLLDHATQRADTLSGGQQQRVAIARALAQEPEFILADEPVASLDPQTGEGILGLLRDIRADGKVAVLCSLHQVQFAQRFADRIVGLAGGRIVVDSPASRFDTTMFAGVYAKPA